MQSRTWPLATAILALVVAACGGAETADTTAPDGATTTTVAQTTTSLSDTATTVAAGTLDGVELKLWGWSSSDAENQALSDLASRRRTTGRVLCGQLQTPGPGQ